MTTQKKDWKRMLVELENKLAEFFTKKLPSMPDKVKEGIVKYGPYLTVIMIILTIPAILAVIGIGMAATPFAFLGGVKGGIGYIISMFLGLVMLILEIIAIKGLFARQMKAWKLMFYISLISAVSNLIKFDLGGLIIGTGISWYVLFQIRSYYKN
ncbi:MAG: chromate transporter [Candidatus Shapirobacteria bacterium]|nr:chromate transporter [Candidatus Shapirobacteria bacterium]MDD4410156.1 chromate transporter [Candidatus Shapirobacteria bacterium]